MLAWLVFGPLVLASALRRGLFVVESRRDRRKLAAGRDAEPAALRAVVEAVAADRGVPAHHEI